MYKGVSQEILDSRMEILKKHIEEDSEWFDDAFLGDFMNGRVEIEEIWLEETQRLIDSEEKVMLDILQSRRAILKTNMTDDANKFSSTEGQKMRGRVVVEKNWLEETENLIDLIERWGK